jgi:NAD(P)-dependent dehydrogenase (short-subunit alcohol dehydrogenase family)
MGVALVSGAGRGIGAAVARALANAGFTIWGVSRTTAELEAVCESIRAKGGKAYAHSGDVARHGAAAGIVRECVRVVGVPDVLVNAAGGQGAIGELAGADPAEWWSILELNLRGTVQMCAAVLPGMLERGRGVIINFSGGGATAPMPNFSAYAASKAAVVRFTETLALEVRDRGVLVNAVAPGVVDTRIQDAVLGAGPRAGAEYDRMKAMRETGAGSVPPELAAELCVHLSTGRTGGLTGKLISAPHDGWREWTAADIDALSAGPWLTLRRIDRHTLEPLRGHAFE